MGWMDGFSRWFDTRAATITTKLRSNSHRPTITKHHKATTKQRRRIGWTKTNGTHDWWPTNLAPPISNWRAFTTGGDSLIKKNILHPLDLIWLNKNLAKIRHLENCWKTRIKKGWLSLACLACACFVRWWMCMSHVWCMCEATPAPRSTGVWCFLLACLSCKYQL